MRLLLAALGVVGFLLFSLILLTYVRQARLAPPETPPPVPPVVVNPPAPVVPELTRALPEPEGLRRLLQQSLTRGGYADAGLTIEQDHGVTTYVLDSPFPDAAELDALLDPLRREAPEVRLETGSAPGALLVLLGDRVVARLQFRPPRVAPLPPPPEVRPPPTAPRPELPPPTSLTPPPPGSGGRVAIVMDDLGRDLTSARELLAIDLGVTFAVIPQIEAAPQVAALAHERGREVLIHMPMEPQGYPRANPGDDALLLSRSDEEIRALVRGYRQRVPCAVGGNNHMGSRFTESREKMAVVLEELRRGGLFFVDSRTSNRSVAFETARELGVATARRDIFLDNVRSVSAIRGEIRRMAGMVKKSGEALAICHPYPETFAALRAEVGYLRSQGISVVPASRLLVR
ncbi:MAG: divergent polysaccharide deacetylase family protein [Trichloromonas sp.]|nr:divergent polysaccharide deacetylase family protein [Trichloromonas sp.]